jgi:hypothetical protein
MRAPDMELPGVAGLGHRPLGPIEMVNPVQSAVEVGPVGTRQRRLPVNSFRPLFPGPYAFQSASPGPVAAPIESPKTPAFSRRFP